MAAVLVEQVTSPVQTPPNHTRYETIHKQRNRILAQAVIQTSRFLVKNCASELGTTAHLTPNHQTIIETLESCLDETHLPKTDQQLIIMLGIGILCESGHTADQSSIRLYQKDGRDIDPGMILRLGRSLHREPDKKPLLWRFIHQKAISATQHTPLIEAYIEALLDEVSISHIDEAMNKTFVNA